MNYKKQYGDNIRLLQMDTDSLIYKLTGVDYRKQIEEDIHWREPDLANGRKDRRNEEFI